MNLSEKFNQSWEYNFVHTCIVKAPVEVDLAGLFLLTLVVNHRLYPWYQKAYGVEQSNKSIHFKHDIIFKV